MNLLTLSFFALLLCSPLTSSAQDLKSISDYIWTWTGPGVNQQVRFQSDGAVLFKGGAKGAWKMVTSSTVEVRMEPGGVKQLEFSADFSSYAEVGATISPIAGVRERLVPELSQKAVSPTPAAPAAPQEIHLLDAEHAPHWKLCGALPITIKDGILSTESPQANGLSILWYSARKFGDFSLTFDYLRSAFGAEGGAHQGRNSGIFVRFESLSNDPSLPDQFGYQIDINSNTGTGDIVRRSRPTQVPEKLGEWNTMEIQMIGSHIWVWLNRILINDYEVGALATGYIGVENWYGGPGVQFRNMRIRELPGEALPLRAPKSLEEALLSYAWTWKQEGINPYETFFLPEGKLKRNTQVRYGWNWSVTGTQNVLVQQLGRGDPKSTFTSDATFSKLHGASFSGVPVVLERSTAILPPARILAQMGRSAPVPTPSHLLASRTGNTPPPVASTPTSPPVSGATVAPPKGAPGTDFQGMILDPDWLPERLGVDQKFTADLRYFSERVLAGEPQGGSTKPTVIQGKLQWLMPISQAIESFGDVTKKPVVKITNQSFPHHSLTVHGLQGRFEDLGYPFNLVHLIADANGQLISVQYVAQAPKKMMWIAGTPVEEKLPYYDFINVKKNGSTTNAVSFQMISSSPGTKLIKMVLHKRGQMQMPVNIPGQPFPQPVVDQTLLYGKWLEDSHWYLPCPLAARFIDIANKALQ